MSGGGETKDTPVTLKQFSDETGIEIQHLMEIVRRDHIELHEEPSKDGTRNVFLYRDLMRGVESHAEELKRRRAEHDAEAGSRILKKVLPEIKTEFGAFIRENLTLATTLRDHTESKVFEALASNRIVLAELRKIALELARLVANVDLAATLGMSAAAARLTASPAQIDASGSAAPRSIADIAASPSAVQGTGEVAEAQRDFLGHAFPGLESFGEDRRAAIMANVALLSRHYRMDKSQLANLPESDRKKIEDILKLWAPEIGDAPKVTSIGAQLQEIGQWIGSKQGKVPIGIIFLALENKVRACIEGDDFMYMMSK